MFNPQNSTAELFQAGNYAAVARSGSDREWQTYAAWGLIGKASEAIAGLSRFSHLPEAVFYLAVTHWIDGNEEQAATMLEKISTPHAQNLLALIRQPQILVLAQLPWTRSGGSDLLTAIDQDQKFKVKNISFHPEDLPNRPYADIHQFYDPSHPPSFYINKMVEWHFIPPNLQELPCPIFGQTGDYDLHIQTVYPWLQLFDEILVTDPSEWQDVQKLVKVPVSTFPKSFGISDVLPPIPQKSRNIDLSLSGTVTHPYHPDKAQLLHQIINIPNLNCKIINGFVSEQDYYQNLANTKVSFTYIRHSEAMPTRGLEALSMGCGLVVQKNSVLTLFAGESEGVLTYELEADNLAIAIQRIVREWPEFEIRARKGAEIIRKEFVCSRVASQSLRFLTFLAAKPRGQRQLQPLEQLVQKRTILQKGWLPNYDLNHSQVLKCIGISNQEVLQSQLNSGNLSSHLFIDLARESILYNYHRALYNLIPVQEWFAGVIKIYQTGLEKFPKSLVLRFNYIRAVLHFGQPSEVSEVLELALEILKEDRDRWQVDVMEDVFPWDFCDRFFNYRSYFDLVTEHLTTGKSVEFDLQRLILASLSYYYGFYAPYQGYYSLSLDYFRQATTLDPEFPYYKFDYAKQLIERNLLNDNTEAGRILIELASESILFIESWMLLEFLKAHQCFSDPQLEKLARKINPIKRQIQLLESIPSLPLKPSLDQVSANIEPDSFKTQLTQLKLYQQKKLQELEKLHDKILWMQTSKFWKLGLVLDPRQRQINLAVKDKEFYNRFSSEDDINQLQTIVQTIEKTQAWQIRLAWLELKKQVIKANISRD
ncbi:MAG: hypothetical protein DCF19_09615 [Pseudanabaena frigida]|uniref:Glycosyltransferase n=1 Tax=Pseudanabaena frigida TaxID=945775 RepID=A0A2W4Y1P2_9CYAN|nr:MAG: hypothetical protein DCF19_09615 [Pseudanabaena frigida]